MLRLLLCFFTIQAFAQMPTKTWRTHDNYINLNGIEVVEKKIYAFSDNGFFFFDKIDNQTCKLSKSDGLAEANVVQIKYSYIDKLLLVAYENGNLDLIEVDEDGRFDLIHNVSFIKNTTTIQTGKRVNAVEFQGGFAYLACDFGLVVLDTKKTEIKETYRNIGAGGSEVSLKRIAFARDSIFVKTTDGILGARFVADVNLQFYGNWKPIFNSQLFQPDQYPEDPLLISPVEIETDTEGKLWIADNEAGLISNLQGTFKNYSPNGTRGTITGIFSLDSKTYALAATVANVFENEEWKVMTLNQLPAYTNDITDNYGFRWQIVSNGVRVMDDATKRSRLYTIGKNSGNLPSTTVNTIAIDKDGIVWMGTNDGIAGVVTARDIFTRQVDAYTPFNSLGRRILLQEAVKKITVDGGNRKWIGTNKGLSLFMPAVDELLLNFTEDNSPLPSNVITDLSLHTQSSELFVLTPKGLLSYKIDASEPQTDFSTVSIFPNPVRPDFQGVLTITGLRENSAVKITDAAGRLIYETKSNGGTAAWNLRDSSVSRTLSGVYMVFCIAEDGSESFVGKVAVVN